MTEDTITPAHNEPVAGPVQRPVRPLVDRLEAAAHAWENSLTVCGDHMPSPAMLREAKAEIERLREALKTAQYRGMVDERIAYKGYSYGMRSMDGIRDLRRAIERDKNY